MTTFFNKGSEDTISPSTEIEYKPQLKFTKVDNVSKRTNNDSQSYETTINTSNNTMLFSRGYPGGGIGIEPPSQNLNIFTKFKEQIEKLKRDLKFTDEKILYELTCKYARVIPEIELLEIEVSDYYSIRIMENIINIKQYSPSFYVNITANKGDFVVYQAFIYLISLITYVSERKDDEAFIKKDVNMPTVIAWCVARNLPDLAYILRGPSTSTNYNVDFKTLYNTLISSSNELFKKGTNITEYMQLMSLKKNEEYLLDFMTKLDNRPNSYNKLQNISETYLIHYDTKYGCKFEFDKEGDLVVNCQDVQIGNGLTKSINLKLDTMLTDNEEIEINSKISSSKLNQLMNYYNTIKINKLLVQKNLYQTSLDIFEKIYIVFPNINLISRTNHVYNNGTLTISGRFVLNNLWYEFIPDREYGISFKETTAYVKKIDYLITDKPGEKSSLSYYQPKIQLSIDKIYNIPLLIPYVKKIDSNDKMILDKKEKNSVIFILHDSELSQLPNSVFIYNITNGIVQWLPIEYCDSDLLNDLMKFDFDYHYNYSNLTNPTLEEINENEGYVVSNNFRDILENEIENSRKTKRFVLKEDNLDFGNNCYKAFYCGTDLINETWSKRDYIYSLYKLFNYQSNDSSYINYQFKDLKLSKIDEFDNIQTNYTRYFVKKINDVNQYMIFEYPTYKINSFKLSINDNTKQYIIQKLTDKLSMIKYISFYDENEITINFDMNVKMILELC